MRRAARIDGNHAEIVNALRHVGCSVHSTAGMHAGFPDLVVGVAGRNLLVEVKDGSLPPSARKLSPLEEAWHAEWRGEVHVITSIDDALALVGDVRRGLR